MYHRIADVAIDPWQLAVHPEHFEQQVKLLREKYNVIPVAELIKQLRQKKLTANTVCLTFDDGYADNYLFAAPILKKYSCPATFFIPSHYVGQQQPFWWDSLQALVLEAPQLPRLFQMSIHDDSLQVDLASEVLLTDDLVAKHKAWYWPNAAPTRRAELYLAIWERLKPLPYADIQSVMDDLRYWAGYAPASPKEALPMTGAQLHQLSQNSLFSIGLHTATHPALAYHPEEAQYHEIAENKKALQPYEPLNAIAFPYGNYNNSTIAVLQKQRVDAGFTTEEKKCTAHTNPHCIGRLQVKNQNGNTFEKQLRQWLKA
jgi:peptidoglycan/xylan/chitin deacetylase (PgdA/CDA1 family)